MIDKNRLMLYNEEVDEPTVSEPVEELNIFSGLKYDPTVNINKYSRMSINDTLIRVFSGQYESLRSLRVNRKTKGYVWLDGNDLVAIVAVEEKDDGYNWITSFEVFGLYRKHGLAKQMLSVAVNTLGATNVVVYDLNEIALKVFNGMGFKTYKKAGNYIYLTRSSRLLASIKDDEKDDDTKIIKNNPEPKKAVQQKKPTPPPVVDKKEEDDDDDWDYGDDDDLDDWDGGWDESTIDYSKYAIINEEAFYDNSYRNPVYIALMHTGTLMANAIKAVTRDEFSHSCIAFNSKLDPLYSFGSKGKGEFGIGFSLTHPTDSFFRTHKAHYSVYVMYVTDKALKAMKTRLDYFNKNKDKLGYDFAGLINIAFGKDSEKHKKYFCSRFVMEIIQQAQELNKVPSLWKPNDIKDLSNISLVNRGSNFFNYDYKVTEKHCDSIKKGSYNVHDVVYEFAENMRLETIMESQKYAELSKYIRSDNNE